MEGSNHDDVVNVDTVVSEIEGEMNGVHPISECCIYRAPYRFQRGQFRKVKKEAYMPKVVSIGPLHHGKESLKNMEEKKRVYLKDFLRWNVVSLRQCVKTVEKGLDKLRSCYEESLGYIKDEQLVKIIVVDAVFVIETLLKHSQKVYLDHNDRMFSPCRVLIDVKTEFLLLENQLPFFILEDLFKFASGINNITLIDCCYSFFLLIGDIFTANEEHVQKIKNEQYKPKHLLDLMRKFYEPLNLPHDGRHCTSVSIPSATQQDDRELKLIPHATKLHQAGIELKVRKTNNLLDICFTKETGTLEIPKLVVSDHTDSILRNLIAFEQCHNCETNYLSDYVALLDSIVSTPNDVDLLVDKGIIENLLGHSDDVSNIINRLGDGVSFSSGDLFSYHRLCADVDSHCKTRWHTWKANLKQNYFNTPWAIISFLGVVVLIVLTIIQTVCSVISTIN